MRGSEGIDIKCLTGGAAFLLWVVVLAIASPLPLANAAGPTHLRDESRDIAGFNHACGAAVDTDGNVYVANAGDDEIVVFDPEHVELTSIGNTNEPCGLAVDSAGGLYVSERATGNVVKYEPNAFPFMGVPTYGGPTTIDTSGEAEGIAIDLFDNRLYVAKGGGVDTYDSEGRLGIDEEQRVNCFECTGGTYTLSFEGSEQTAPIDFEGPAGEVEEALEDLSTIGAGNVSVTGDGAIHFVTFTGSLSHTDVPLLAANSSSLVGGGSKAVLISEQRKGFAGRFGEGDLTEATGVAVYTRKVSGEAADRYLFVADAANNEIKVFSGSDIRALELRRSITGPSPSEDFSFGPAGAYLAVDPGNAAPDGKCAQIGNQACTAGHLLVYDDGREAVQEFDASGEFLDEIANSALADAEPTGFAIDRSGGEGDGTIYVTTGPGAGSKVLAFEPLKAPDRKSFPLPDPPPLSKVLPQAQAVATDSVGNTYVAAASFVHIYDPESEELLEFATPQAPVDLAVDSEGGVYLLLTGNGTVDPAQYQVRYCAPSAFPPDGDTAYDCSETVATGNDFVSPVRMTGIAVNPASDQIYVLGAVDGQILRLGSANEGWATLDPCFACEFTITAPVDIAVYGANGNVYVSEQFQRILGFEESGEEVVVRINGRGSPLGLFPSNPNRLTVDQSNGHVLAFNNVSRQAVEEYDASGAFVGRFFFPEQQFGTVVRITGLAIDNSGGPSNGNLYVAFDDAAPGTPDLWAFGPLTYGEAPNPQTGTATAVGGGAATLNGTVDPRGAELESCEFEYLLDTGYLENGKTFSGATGVPCAETPAEIGDGSGPVSVHADVSGLEATERYRFRLVAQSQFGQVAGNAGLFGPPVANAKTPLPVHFTEAMLRGQVDPSGLATTYRFQYGTTEGEYDHETPAAPLPAGDGPVTVQAVVLGLAEGTEYHFRLLATNEAGSATSPEPDLAFTTKRREEAQCSNEEFRTGLSASLPDCRAYELATPAETRGAVPYASLPGTAGEDFNNWLVTPRGPGAGGSLAFSIDGTLPGFDGTGATDSYRSRRAPGEHPPAGWSTELISPSFAEAGGGSARSQGVAAEHDYWFYLVSNFGELEGGLPAGRYLRTPTGFEPIGKGSVAADDLEARGRLISTGGEHVIFTSDNHLEVDAAPVGTESIYDRAATAPSATVLSLKPDGTSFGAGEGASYVGANEAGTAVAFKVDTNLYLHRAGQTFPVAEGTSSFAGISEDGTRLFYTDGSDPGGSGAVPPANLYLCDTTAGPCTGGEPSGRTQIAAHAVFVNVAPDGSAALLSSEDVLTGAEENEAGEFAEANEPNLYLWDGDSPRFAAILDPTDLESFGGDATTDLSQWSSVVGAGTKIGRAFSPTRSTLDGEVFVFQSHAQLTAYDNEGVGEIYRYEPAAPSGAQLLCVSCDPASAPPSGADAMLQSVGVGFGFTSGRTLIANLTDDGQAVFFESADPLLPTDANAFRDVYQWKAPTAAGCEDAAGCLSLISSGQGEGDSLLFGMSADGRDVHFSTKDQLVSTDVSGSPSIYDARVEGGIPTPAVEEPCHGDACQGAGSAPPVLLPPASATIPGEGNLTDQPPRKCRKGMRKVKRKGKVRCVKRPARKNRGGQRNRGGRG